MGDDLISSNIVTRSHSIDSMDGNDDVVSHAPIRQKKDPALKPRVQQHRGGDLRVDGRKYQRTDLIADMKIAVNSLVSKWKNRNTAFKSFLAHTALNTSHDSFQAIGRTMQELLPKNGAKHGDLKILAKDILKVSAGKTGIRAFGKKNTRAMALRQEVREAALLAYLKTGSIDVARKVKQDMITSMTATPPGGKSDFKKFIDADCNQIRNLDLRFNDIKAFVEKASPEQLQAAVGKGSLVDQKLIADMPKNPPNDFVEKGGAEPGGRKQNSIDIANDEAIAIQWQHNFIDQHKVTSGKVDVEDLQTKGNDPDGLEDEGMDKDDPAQIANDEQIAIQWQHNFIDHHKLTAGKVDLKDLQTKRKAPNLNEGVDETILPDDPEDDANSDISDNSAAPHVLHPKINRHVDVDEDKEFEGVVLKDHTTPGQNVNDQDDEDDGDPTVGGPEKKPVQVVTLGGNEEN